jgi:metal-dependent amidase/aminoacylase/carboxypeptidase family protein
MSSKDELKRAACEAIDRRADAIIDLGETILRNPKTGFNESKTAALVAQRMTALGLAPQTGLALTGVKGRLAGGKPGPRLAFIGELDSLRTSEHPLADPVTGAAHSCGHNAQIAGMLGAAIGLIDEGRRTPCRRDRFLRRAGRRVHAGQARTHRQRPFSTMSTWR